MSSATGSYMPSRLLYVPPDPTKGFVLRPKENVPQGAKYVALSHCWGSRDKWPRCLTTSANYEQQLSHIPWDTIPQTFRDTAIFARKLGLEYIWIDSMCIIQGDERDWQRESTKMYSVYSNAYITFAAAAAHDSHDGLFSRRAPGSLVPLLTLGFRGKLYNIEAYKVPYERWEFELQFDMQAQINYSYPLFTRAWAFQERLVSPRVLFFGVEELIWECPAGRSCEEDTYSPPLSHERDDDEIERREVFMHHYSTITCEPHQLAAHWVRILTSYNELKLSEPTDRLPAIAAIAQSFAQRNPDDEYVCGLWKNSIQRGLLFGFLADQNVTGPQIDYGPSAMAQSNYIAPSWSWASFQGGLYGNLPVSPVAELTSVNLRHIDNDQFGRVAPGSSITLRAPILDCVWDLKYQPDGNLKWFQSVSIPCSEGTMSFEFQRQYSTYSGLGRREAIDVCLILVGTPRDGGCGALILRRISDGGHYFRVGRLWELESSSEPPAGLTRVLEEAPVRECVIE